MFLSKPILEIIKFILLNLDFLYRLFIFLSRKHLNHIFLLTRIINLILLY